MDGMQTLIETNAHLTVMLQMFLGATVFGERPRTQPIDIKKVKEAFDAASVISRLNKEKESIQQELDGRVNQVTSLAKQVQALNNEIAGWVNQVEALTRQNQGLRDSLQSLKGKGLCSCDCGSTCPRGKMGMDTRCTADELRDTLRQTIERLTKDLKMARDERNEQNNCVSDWMAKYRRLENEHKDVMARCRQLGEMLAAKQADKPK